MGLTDTSKFSSLILRHKPETIGIKLDEHGWADVSELISGISKTRPFDMKMLEEIVRTDNREDRHFLVIKMTNHLILVFIEKKIQYLLMLNLKRKLLQSFFTMEREKSLFHQSIKKDYFQRAGYMFIYQRILRQQLRWAAGMESLWFIRWQLERWQMSDMSFSYL